MSAIGSPERVTQDRVIKMFQDELKYRYLGDWSDRQNNSNVEVEILFNWLTSRGVDRDLANRAIGRLITEATNPSRDLYDSNKEVYKLLRYGVQVQATVDANYVTVHLIDWDNPKSNDFAVAQEITLSGDHDRRPDVVLYVNGIAIAVLELKNSRISVGDGIRQNLSNQQPQFHAWFFSTIQLVFAGNDSQGLRYGTILTPEKFFMSWKEDEADNSRIKLDKYLLKMCDKERVIEFLHDFILFDAGQKKVPRPHQYLAVKDAQTRVSKLEGGVIWHTQGSGKSIVMVLLARWILRTRPNARVVVVTDRDELDKQIDSVFSGADEAILRTSSGADLMANLAKATPRLLCSLVHKFSPRSEDFDAFITELGNSPSKTVGEIFVFVDECHRTQSGKLHKAMNAVMPGAILVGFTGTPLLTKDRKTTLETFGTYIHTYKFKEAVEDGVVLDLVYEARNVEQTLGSEEQIDEWFNEKTKDLNEWQKAELRSQWGTFSQVRSSKSRIERIATCMVYDFGVKPLLRAPDCLGNAILVASSIYEATKYYEYFQGTALRGRVALVTSYDPRASDITLEDTGANTQTDKEYIYEAYKKLLEHQEAAPGQTPAETYRDRARYLFVHEPARMRLLIVVDMCLTGFDPPDCTYMYIDKQMQDHGLFQAICRTNRVSGDWKTVGCIVDFKDLFSNVEDSIAVYSSELDHSDGGPAPEIMLQNRLAEAKTRLTDALEFAEAVIEKVGPPKQEIDYIHYFCGNTEIPDDLANTQPRREGLYNAIAAVVRAYSNIAADMSEAGYTEVQIKTFKSRVEFFAKLRDTIRFASGEQLDTKTYEADMRQLIDMYVEAKAPVKVSAFGETPLLEILTKSGVIEATNALPEPIRSSEAAVAETITNNVRSTIVKRQTADPAFYAKMSTLLAQIVAELKARQISYAKYLKSIAELAKRIQKGSDDNLPSQLATPGDRALYNNIPGDSEEERTDLALAVGTSVKKISQADWRGDHRKEQSVMRAIFEVVGDESLVEQLFSVIKQQGEF